MQVFVPYPDIRKSVSVLDPKRLGNQVYNECYVLISGKWSKHLASRAWQGHFHALALYALAGLDELKSRGRYYPHQYERFEYYKQQFPDTGMPKWWGNPDVHISHMSNLIRKKPEYYKPLFPGIPDNLPYVWLPGD